MLLFDSRRLPCFTLLCFLLLLFDFEIRTVHRRIRFSNDERCHPTPPSRPPRGFFAVVWVRWDCSRRGFALEMSFASLEGKPGGQVLLEGRNPQGDGIWVSTGSSGGLLLAMRDTEGRNASLVTDALCTAQLNLPGRHHVTFSADGGPLILSVISVKLLSLGD